MEEYVLTDEFGRLNFIEKIRVLIEKFGGEEGRRINLYPKRFIFRN